jgi:hypothetical protein
VKSSSAAAISAQTWSNVRGRRAEKRFQFGEGEFDRIEVGAVGWEKPELSGHGFDGGADLRLFVDGEVIEDDHIARLERRRQDFLGVRSTMAAY